MTERTWMTVVYLLTWLPIWLGLFFWVRRDQLDLKRTEAEHKKKLEDFDRQMRLLLRQTTVNLDPKDPK